MSAMTTFGTAHRPWLKTYWYDKPGTSETPREIHAISERTFKEDMRSCREVGYQFLVNRDDLVVVHSGPPANRVYIVYVKTDGYHGIE